MKKIIKITALILALICIGTSCAACGKHEDSTILSDTLISTMPIQTISNAEMAENIRNKMKIKSTYIYTNSKGDIINLPIAELGGPELFNLKGSNLMLFKNNPNKPENASKDYDVTVNENEREIIVNLYGQGCSDGYNGNNRFEIIIPYEIKNANCGNISISRKTLTIDFLTENIQTMETTVDWDGYVFENECYYITQKIIINY